MSFFLGVLAWFAIPAVLGVLIRRRWLLAVVLVVWLASVVYALVQGVNDRDTTDVGWVIATTIYMLIPAEAGAVLGIVLGRRLTAR